MINKGDLQNRDVPGGQPAQPRGAAEADATIARMGNKQPAQTAESPKAAKEREAREVLKVRLDEAKALTPPEGTCRVCFEDGRDSALKALDATSGSFVDRVAAARNLQPTHYHAGDRSFQTGRDAVLKLATWEGAITAPAAEPAQPA